MPIPSVTHASFTIERLYKTPPGKVFAAFADPAKKRLLDEMVMLMESSLRARAKVLLEMNVSSADLERIVKDLPCMKAPTVCQLYGEQGYAVKVAVPKADVPALVPRLVALGARDILEYRLERIVI